MRVMTTIGGLKALGVLLLALTLWGNPGAAWAALNGSHDGTSCASIHGWAWDSALPNTPINVEIYSDGVLVATVPAGGFRQDLLNAGIGNGNHAFQIAPPAAVLNGQPHSIRVKFAGTQTNLPGTPRSLNCIALGEPTPVYEGFHEGANCSLISGWAWDSQRPNTPINVDVYADGAFLLTTPANQFRQDLLNAGKGNGAHGFGFATPNSVKNGTPRSIAVRFAGTQVNLSATPKTINCAPAVSLSGTITYEGGPLSGAAVAGSNGASCSSTNASGEYTCTVAPGWSGTVTPSMAERVFTPASRSYTNVTAAQPSQGYTANATFYQVSGTVTLNGIALPNVAMAATGGPTCTTTNNAGQYSCTVPFNWSGSVTPTATGYSFGPASRSYTSVSSTQTAQTFTATLDTATAPLYFVHVDHLNTPRLVANDAQQAVWRWDQQEPFGVNVPDENPSSLGAFEFPFRFPGQYSDKESNLFYNYFRDYDAYIGRYLASDPIGIEGGLNTYAYVDGDPISRYDPDGKRYVRWCGRCKIIYDSDQWKGAHTHWECPGQPQGCIKKNGELCDGSAPPPSNVRDCLQRWNRIPSPKQNTMTCGPTCQTVGAVIVVGGLVVVGACLAGPIGGTAGGTLGATIMMTQ